jgi:hypothetical protein
MKPYLVPEPYLSESFQLNDTGFRLDMTSSARVVDIPAMLDFSLRSLGLVLVKVPAFV